MKFNLNDWLRAAHRAKFEAMSPERQDFRDEWGGTLVINPLVCADGFSISVQASASHYCAPRVDLGPWTQVECGFPSDGTPSLQEWKDGDEPDARSVFGWVPVSVVEALIESHGGVK